jgi:O-antigen/teichoic acid export membrane protein
MRKAKAMAQSLVLEPARQNGLKGLKLIGPRLAAIVAQLVFLPFVLHGLTIRDYGLFALASMIANLVALLSFPQISFGSKVALARGLDGQFLYALFKRIQLSIPIMVLTCSGLLIYGLVSEARIASVIAVALVGTLASSIIFQAMTAFWIAREQFLWASSVDLIRAVLTNGGGAIAAMTTRDLLVFIVARIALDVTLSALLFCSLLARAKLWQAYREKRIDPDLEAFGLRMFWANCAVLARTEGISFIVAGSFGVEALAIFRVAYSSIYSRIQNQMSNLTDIVYAKNSRQRDRSTSKTLIRQFLILSILGATVAGAAVIFSYFYIRIAIPNTYSAAFGYVFILLVAIPIDIVYSYVNQILLIRYDHRSIIILLTFHLFVQMLGLVILMKAFGLFGVCFSVLVALIFSLALGVFLERRGGMAVPS